MIDLYLMAPPPPGWALRARANFRSRDAEAVDPIRARAEWLVLARAIEDRGGTVVALPTPSDALTGMPYAAEAGQVIDRADGPARFLLPRMISPHRQPERDHWGPLAKKLGLEVVEPASGIWEAQGDVAMFGGVTLLFFGGRTDRAGLEAAAGFFEGELLRVQIREPAFHGNMAVLPLPSADHLLVCPEVITPDSLTALERRFGRARLIPVTEAEIRDYATNALPIGRELLAPSLFPDRVRRLVEKLDMKVTPFRLTELCDKGGGAARCLVSYARLPADKVTLPEEHRLDAVARSLSLEE